MIYVFILLVNIYNLYLQVYDTYKQDRFFGSYEGFKPSIFITDTELIKQVLVKEFDSFSSRRIFGFGSESEMFNEMLSIVNGDRWKKLRATMSPTFSSGKMKHMFEIVHEQAKNFVVHCEKFYDKKEKFDIKESFGRYTMDVIASSAFGIECRSLQKENAIFATMAEKMFSTSIKQVVKTFIIFFFPRLANIIGITFSTEALYFFRDVCKQTTAERRKNGNNRGDFLDLLLIEQEKQKESFDETKDYKITDNTILAESSLFFIAGYDTTANALSMTSYYLAKHRECQKLLREELLLIKEKNGTLNYHDIMEAKYLDACINETLRLIPPLPALERACTKDYQIPDSNITIEKGMIVEIPVWGLHRDPELWDNPNSFQPERFMPGNKDIKPFTYMPFGMGPRNCIAMRFALMEAKICVAEFVLNYDFSLAPGHGDLRLENGGGVIRPKKDCISIILNKKLLTKTEAIVG